MKIAAIICRVLVGLLFIFSGFVKANDPLGFSYKLQEYYHVFGLGFLTSSALYQAMFISVLEMVLGFAVLIGTRMKITGGLILAMIIFFTLLTGYTAISNWFFENPDSGTTQWFAGLFGFTPKNIYYMTDCGCFGEFIKLTPWQSFSKDVILLLLIIIIFIRRKQTRSLFSRSMQTNIIVTLSVLFTVFTVYCNMFLPAVNFLNWKEGTDVAKLMVCPPDAPRDSVQMTFVYKVNGQPTTFSYDDVMAMKVPNDAVFVSQDKKIIRKGCIPTIFGFSMYDGEIDYKDSMLQNNDYQLLVLSYDLEHARKNGLKKLTTLTQEFIEKDGKKVWGLTGTILDDAEKVRHEYNYLFSFYNTDPKMLKSMIRSNAGLILMKGSVVIETWPARSIPTPEKVRKIMAKNQ
jgi:uncharacterized membrane protein YphA (DoxX/SURF4 family)